MGKRKHTRAKSNDDGMVYSTNPGYDWDAHDEEEEAEDWTVASCATLYVSVDRKQRAGKPVTVVEGFDGPAMELLALGKTEGIVRGWRFGEGGMRARARRPTGDGVGLA